MNSDYFWSFFRFFNRPTFTAKDVPDHSGKVVLVTGGNTGIGKETCLALAEKGARVYVGARSKERAQGAIDEIKEATGSKDVHWLKLDLSDLSSVKQAAEEFKSKETELHTLYNNAGVMMTPFSLTKDGFEIQWGTNVVGHFLLTKLLLPVLLNTASHNPKGTVRVVNVSSFGHNLCPPNGINFEDLTLKDQSTVARYGQSKLGNVLMSNEIARRYGKDGIQSFSLHPGAVDTELERGARESWGWVVMLNAPFRYFFYLSPKEGAITSLFAGTHPDAGKPENNGKYLIPFGKFIETSALGKDVELGKRLWDYLEDVVKDKL